MALRTMDDRSRFDRVAVRRRAEKTLTTCDVLWYQFLLPAWAVGSYMAAGVFLFLGVRSFMSMEAGPVATTLWESGVSTGFFFFVMGTTCFFLILADSQRRLTTDPLVREVHRLRLEVEQLREQLNAQRDPSAPVGDENAMC